jgi:hypothetical protein
MDWYVSSYNELRWCQPAGMSIYIWVGLQTAFISRHKLTVVQNKGEDKQTSY